MRRAILGRRGDTCAASTTSAAPHHAAEFSYDGGTGWHLPLWRLFVPRRHAAERTRVLILTRHTMQIRLALATSAYGRRHCRPFLYYSRITWVETPPYAWHGKISNASTGGRHSLLISRLRGATVSISWAAMIRYAFTVATSAGMGGTAGCRGQRNGIRAERWRKRTASVRVRARRTSAERYARLRHTAFGGVPLIG